MPNLKKSFNKEKAKKVILRLCELILIALIVFLFFALISTTKVTSSLKIDLNLIAKESIEKVKDYKEKIIKEYEEKPKKVTHDSLRGIYVTASTASLNNFQELVDKLISSGGNFIVMDIEHSGGLLAFIPEDEYLLSKNPGSSKLSNLKQIVEELHKKDIYVAARQVVFNDPYAGSRYPEWRIKSKFGGYFDTNWIDPSNPEVQNYNLLITKEIAKLGFDEVQYDYIRFPAKNHNNLEYFYDETLKEPWQVINDFLIEAHKLTKELDIKLGMDVFGATIWGDVDWKSVGQNIPEVAKNVDVIYPMTYPSHVSPGYYGFKNPWGDPGSFVRESIKKFREVSAGNAEIRTWVQGFPLKATNFGDWYVKAQVNGTYDAGATGWVIWSPGNIYGHSWSSMSLVPPKKEEPVINTEITN